MHPRLIRKICSIPLIAAAILMGPLEACASRALTVHAGAPKAGTLRTDCRYVTWHSNTTISIASRVSSPCKTRGPIEVEVLRGDQVVVRGVHRALSLDSEPQVLSSAVFTAPKTRTEFRIRFRAKCEGSEEKLLGIDDCDAP